LQDLCCLFRPLDCCYGCSCSMRSMCRGKSRESITLVYKNMHELFIFYIDSLIQERYTTINLK
jgi:hypothetical protein